MSSIALDYVTSSNVFSSSLMAIVLIKYSIFCKTVHAVGKSELLLYSLELYLIAATCRFAMYKTMVGIIDSQSYFVP